MNTSFLTKKTIFGIIALLILLGGLAGGVYLSQRQTQLKSEASTCSPSDYGPNPGSTEWCACAAEQGNIGALQQYKCPQAPQTNTCANSCGACATNVDKCGNTVYSGNCDYSTCTSPDSTYRCTSSGNNSCQGAYRCGSSCATAPAAPAQQPAAPQPAQGCPLSDWQNRTNEELISNCSHQQLSQLPNERLMTFPLGVLAQFSNDRLDDFPLSFLSGFSNERLLQFSNDFLLAFPNDRLITLPIDRLKTFPPSRIDTFPCNVRSQLGRPCSGEEPAGGVANPDDGATCQTPQANLIDPKTGTKVPYVIANTEYKARLVMKNTGQSTWKANQYTLVPSELTKTTWLAQPVALKQDVASGSEAVFDVNVKSPATPDGNHLTVGYYFRMANNNVQFGAACEPQVIDITPPPPAATSTACFVISENFADVTAVTKCDDANGLSKGIIKEYTGTPTTVPYTLQDNIVGIKTVYVRFISSTGEIKDINKQIRFSPDPVLDVVACTHSATGIGTLVGIRGQNFGEHRQQGQGSVKVNGQNATITSWNGATNTIIASVPNRLEGEQSVELKLDDGRTVVGKCNVGISTVQFTVNTQCTLPGTYSATGVDVRIQEATSGARPILSKKININKGVPVDFAPSIETGKKYSLIIKGPETLVKKVDFVADEGSKNLGEIKLWIGDIAPRVAPDGRINSLDKSEMAKQWSLLETTSVRSADLNKDSTVNSHDYSCQKLGFNQQDDVTLTTSQSN